MRYMKNYEFMRDYLAGRENLGFPHIVIVSGMTIYLTGEDTFEVKDNAFNSCGLISVTVPKNVVDIGDYVWCHCHNLREATFESVNPPKMNGGTLFSDCPNLTTVYVPGGSIDKYKRARGWSYFAEKMKPIEER